MEEKIVNVEIRNVRMDDELENAIIRIITDIPRQTSITIVNEYTCSEIMIRAN